MCILGYNLFTIHIIIYKVLNKLLVSSSEPRPAIITDK